MLGVIAGICVFLIIPIALVLPNLGRLDQPDGGVGHVPYVMAAAMAGWWFLGIWVPCGIAALCILYVLGAYAESKKAKEQASSSTASQPVKQEFSGGADVWRGSQKAGGQLHEFGSTPTVDFVAPASGDADSRLQAHYDDLQDGKIALDDYKAQIELELDLAKIEIENLRSMRRDMDRDDYEEQREKADEDLEAARWRLSWVKQKIREQGNKPDWMGKSGKWAIFEYSDSDGALTKHHITMWKAYGDEVRGWDRKLKAEVGFAFDQIHEWQAG